jgi:UDP-N-acetylmuramate dehydrogenase
MVPSNLKPATCNLQLLKDVFGEKLQTGVSLARYTAARVGGPADAFLAASSAEELAEIVSRLWELGLPGEGAGELVILGGGSNVLISDRGVRGVVVLNRARQMRFDEQADPPRVWCESGVNFGLAARQAAARGLTGLEWAAGIPGTVGGAVFGNAGAYGGDVAGNFRVAEILHQGYWGAPGAPRRETCGADRLLFEYRSSLLKRSPGKAVVLSAEFSLGHSTPEAVLSRIEALGEQRRRTQPPGASMGSMFKNPPGDFAGRLIEAAGLKGTRLGEAEISPLHANFFINHGKARAADVQALIRMAQEAVARKLGVELELEIELVGEWLQG